MNPWLNIPFSDYDNHMNEVGQSALLSEIFSHYLQKYKPVHMALPGCATGNGLDRVDTSVTKRILAMDINPDYLQKLRDTYLNSIPGLETYCIDFDSDKLPEAAVDFVFAALILEYVNPAIFIPKIADLLNSQAKLVIIIQKSQPGAFVSPTSYKSLNALSGIAAEVDENNLYSICSPGLLKVNRNEYMLNESKSFIIIEFEKV